MNKLTQDQVDLIEANTRKAAILSCIPALVQGEVVIADRTEKVAVALEAERARVEKAQEVTRG